MNNDVMNLTQAEALSDEELRDVSGGEILRCNITNPYSQNYPYYIQYRAVSGSSFWSIATAFRVDINVLKHENPQYQCINYRLSIGNIVYIPQRSIL